MNKLFKRTILLLFIAGFSLCIVNPTLITEFAGSNGEFTNTQVPERCRGAGDLEHSLLTGYIINSSSNEPLINYSVTIEGSSFIGNQTQSDGKGHYSLYLPEGSFILRVLNPSGIEVFNEPLIMLFFKSVRKDLVIDPSRTMYSYISGKIQNKLGEERINVYIDIHSLNGRQINQTIAINKDRTFNITTVSGPFLLEFRYKDQIIERREVETNWGKTTILNLSLDLPVEVEERGQITDRIVEGIKEKWTYLVGMLVTFFIGVVLVNLVPHYTHKWLSRIEKFLTEHIIHLILRFIRTLLVMTMILIELFLLGYFVKIIHSYVWENIKPHVFNIYFVVLIIYLIMILRNTITSVVDYRVSKEKINEKEGKDPEFEKKMNIKGWFTLSAEQLTTLAPILRYLVLVLGILLIMSTILSSFGAKGSIFGSVTTFFSNNSNYLYFVAILILIVWLVKRMITIIFDDMAKRVKKIHPATVQLAGKGLNGVLVAFTVMIVMVAILQMAELGEISSVILSIAIVSIGVVSGISSAGGMSNLITGMAVKAFRPVDIGDRVKIGEKVVGDVIDITNVNIKLRNLENEIVTIPHNEILQNTTTNFSESAPVVITVGATIGYDTPHEDVEALFLKVAAKTPGIISEPPSKVLLMDMQDYYISYQLRCYVDDVNNIIFIKSNLIKNCHTIFYENGVEIMSPHFFVRRAEEGPSDQEMKDSVTPKLKELGLKDLFHMEDLISVNKEKKNRERNKKKRRKSTKPGGLKKAIRASKKKVMMEYWKGQKNKGGKQKAEAPKEEMVKVRSDIKETK